MTLGGANSSLYQGSVNWVPLVGGQGSYWLVNIDGELISICIIREGARFTHQGAIISLGAKVGSTSVPFTGQTAAIDTGTSML
jgi:hypothetical protein